MSKLIKPIVFLYFLLGTFFLSEAQRPTSGNNNSTLIELTGKIVDQNEGKALDYATIALLNANDSSLVEGTVSNTKGDFRLEAPAGAYLIRINFIGYETLFIKDVQLKAENPVVKLKTINLAPIETTLDEVEVVAQKNRVQFALDKRVVNVGKDLNTIGGTAADVLDNIPSITVDIEGEVSLRGSNSVRILINGRPSLLSGADALQQLPADLLDRVEVITNPSARYEAEGSAGIINIILKKDKRQGWNGSFNATVGQPASHNGSININRRSNKLNLFASVGARYRNSPRTSFEHRELYDNAGDIRNVLDSYTDSRRGGISGNLRLGADFELNKYNTITGSLNYRKSDDFSNSDIEYFDFGAANILNRIELRNSEEDEGENEIDYNLSWDKTFAQKGRKWSTALVYSGETETQFTSAEERNFDEERRPVPTPDQFQRIDSEERVRRWTLQSDYVHPMTKNRKFEAGFRGSIQYIDSDFLIEDLNPETQLWIVDEGQSNQFEYDEYIYAAYAIFGDKVNKFSYQFGLRAEHTEITTHLVETNEKFDKKYTNLFPSVFFSYDLPNENAVQISYSRRVRRPRFYYLNPFSSFSNPLSVRQGNPDLDPAFTDAYEINYIKYWEKSSLSSSLYYRNTNGLIQRVNRTEPFIDSNGEEQVRNISYPLNLSRRQDIGFEVSFTWDFAKWVSVNTNANLYKGIVDGSAQGFSTTHFFSWTSRTNAQFKIDPLTEAQITINYRGPEQNPQGKRYDFLYTDIGISRDIMKKKATVNFRVVDLFKTAWYRYESFGDDFFVYREGQWRTIQQFYFGFVYRLNQKKRKSRQRQMNFNFED